MSPQSPKTVLQWRLSWEGEIKSWVWDFFFFFFLALLSVLDIPLENVSNLFNFLIGVELLYSFVFISVVQHESAISIDMSPPS